MPNLWQLTDEALDLESRLLTEVGPDGSIPDDLARALDEIEEGLEAKAEVYAQLIRKMSAAAEMYRREADRWSKAATAQANAAKRMRGRICETMEQLGLKSLGPFKVAKNGGRLPVQIFGAVPDEFTKREPDMESIRQRLSRGEVLNFAKFAPRGTHVRINP